MESPPAPSLYVWSREQRMGPLSLQELRAYLASGTVSLNDLAWQEGENAWKPLSALLNPPFFSSLPPEVPKRVACQNDPQVDTAVSNAQRRKGFRATYLAPRPKNWSFWKHVNRTAGQAMYPERPVSVTTDEWKKFIWRGRGLVSIVALPLLFVLPPLVIAMFWLCGSWLGAYLHYRRFGGEIDSSAGTLIESDAAEQTCSAPAAQDEVGIEEPPEKPSLILRGGCIFFVLLFLFMMIVFWASAPTDTGAVGATKSDGSTWILLLIMALLLVLVVSLLLLPVYLYRPWRLKFRVRFRWTYRMLLCGNLLNLILIPGLILFLALLGYVEKNRDMLFKRFPDASILETMVHVLKSGEWLN
jgi:hypothetical protein